MKTDAQDARMNNNNNDTHKLLFRTIYKNLFNYNAVNTDVSSTHWIS